MASLAMGGTVLQANHQSTLKVANKLKSSQLNASPTSSHQWKTSQADDLSKKQLEQKYYSSEIDEKKEAYLTHASARKKQ